MVKEPMELMEFLAAKMPDASRTKLKALLSKRVVYVDSVITTQYNFPLKPGMKVQISREKGRKEFNNKLLKIVYEDAYLIVVEKMQGLLSVNTERQKERTAYTILNEYVQRSGRQHRVYIVHRLDRDTSGLLMFAKDETGVTEMRAGVCALFDLFMSNVGACTVDDIAGSVLATVIGRQVDKRRVILDCGFLALSRDRGTARQTHDYGYGLVCGIDGKPLADGTIVLTGTNQEHGILTLPENSPLTQEDFPIGRRLRILPNHACPTAAPYASLVLIENGRVAEVLDHVRGWD